MTTTSKLSPGQHATETKTHPNFNDFEMWKTVLRISEIKKY